MNLTKRTKILVDPTVQLAICKRIAMHWLMFCVCLVSINTLIGTILSVADVGFFEAMVTSARGQIHVAFIFAMMLPMFLFDTMKMSNRFAGPMFRLRKALHELPTESQKRRLSFRSGDFWPEVAVEFNRVAAQHDELRLRNAVLESQVRELRKQLELQPV